MYYNIFVCFMYIVYVIMYIGLWNLCGVDCMTVWLKSDQTLHVIRSRLASSWTGAEIVLNIF